MVSTQNWKRGNYDVMMPLCLTQINTKLQREALLHFVFTRFVKQLHKQLLYFMWSWSKGAASVCSGSARCSQTVKRSITLYLLIPLHRHMLEATHLESTGRRLAEVLPAVLRVDRRGEVAAWLKSLTPTNQPSITTWRLQVQIPPPVEYTSTSWFLGNGS